ncbi:hypothetical protein TNCV_4456101 [Trichonephila clavipes]|nr:hypothetical protein TNCV_4456101 [Trichonephila clavipes]
MGAQSWCSKRGRISFIEKSVDSIEGSQNSCAALRALAINSREQFIREQREYHDLGHIYRYLENPDDCVLLMRRYARIRVHRSRQTDTISSDSPVETLYDEQEVSHGSNRSNQEQFKEHRKTSIKKKLRGVDHGRVTPHGRTPETNAK